MYAYASTGQGRLIGSPQQETFPPLLFSSLTPPTQSRGAVAWLQVVGQLPHPPAFRKSGPFLQTRQEPLEGGKQRVLASWSRAPPVISFRAGPLTETHRPPPRPSTSSSLRCTCPSGLPGVHSQEPSPGGAEVLVSILGGLPL